MFLEGAVASGTRSCRLRRSTDGAWARRKFDFSLGFAHVPLWRPNICNDILCVLCSQFTAYDRMYHYDIVQRNHRCARMLDVVVSARYHRGQRHKSWMLTYLQLQWRHTPAELRKATKTMCNNLSSEHALLGVIVSATLQPGPGSRARVATPRADRRLEGNCRNELKSTS